MTRRILLGDEAVAQGDVHAGISSAYAYPGTPSTEILEFLIDYERQHRRPHAAWCGNEKTAYEAALGTSFAGRRALVCMKHVGLHVAADAFVNSALVAIHGGLVLAVADDPGMHSSQNEQGRAGTAKRPSDWLTSSSRWVRDSIGSDCCGCDFRAA